MFKERALQLQEGQVKTYQTEYGSYEAICFDLEQREYWVKRYLNNDRYEVRGIIGLGGFGCVFGAYDRWNYNKKVVIKAPYYMGDYCFPLISRGCNTFERQIKSLNKIYEREKKHLSRFSNAGFDSIVNLNDYFLDISLDLGKKFRDAAGVDYYISESLRDHAPYLVMKYIRGEQLKDIIEKKGISLEESLSLARQVLILMTYLHEVRSSKKGRNFYYLLCDLKAENVIVTDKNQVSLIDFGAVKVHWCDQGEIETPIFVTDGYAAPEVYSGSLEFRDNTRIDKSFDIFTVGAFLCHCLSRQHPQIFLVNKNPPQHQFNLEKYEQIPPKMKRIILKATSRERDQRYSCAQEMLADIEKFQEEK